MQVEYVIVPVNYNAPIFKLRSSLIGGRDAPLLFQVVQAPAVLAQGVLIVGDYPGQLFALLDGQAGFLVGGRLGSGRLEPIVRQAAHGFFKVYLVEQFHKADRTAGRPAAEALEQVFYGIDVIRSKPHAKPATAVL